MGQRLDTSIFQRSRSAEQAQRARKIEKIYHTGQDKIWDGQEVLATLAAAHGDAARAQPVRTKEAISAVVGGLMWGELAAWQISAQLADRVVDFEAKLAATSQVHDEARHFYVLHDYLELIGVPARPPTRHTRALIEVVLGAENLVHKLVGMQLFIESIALTIFKSLRERQSCPLLTELLLFFERDEARHVGFGVQYTPDLVRGFGLVDQLALDAFQTRILGHALLSLREMEPHLHTLGVPPRLMAQHGLQRMTDTVEMLSDVAGERFHAVARPAMTRTFQAAIEALFPEVPSLRARLYATGRALLPGGVDLKFFAH